MMKRGLMGLIRLYQRYLSPLKRVPSCRFVPTCSCYALEAIERRGAVVGTLKTLWRLLRCNPLFPGGYDPVERPHDLPGASDVAKKPSSRSSDEHALGLEMGPNASTSNRVSI